MNLLWINEAIPLKSFRLKTGTAASNSTLAAIGKLTNHLDLPACQYPVLPIKFQ
jgi:hypothetical protein